MTLPRDHLTITRIIEDKARLMAENERLRSLLARAARYVYLVRARDVVGDVEIFRVMREIDEELAATLNRPNDR
jgi:hypothetical protein